MPLVVHAQVAAFEHLAVGFLGGGSVLGRGAAQYALVDDDRNILTSVSIALEAEGYRIDTYTESGSYRSEKGSLSFNAEMDCRSGKQAFEAEQGKIVGLPTPNCITTFPAIVSDVAPSRGNECKPNS